VGKGADFERQVCRMLSLWWTDDEDADVFWRNRTRATKQSPDAKHQLGDIMAMKAVGAPLIERINIETKNGYSKTRKGTRMRNIPWDLLDLIDGKLDGKKQILEFWTQCQRDAELSKRIPMLIFKRDFHEPVVVLESTVVLGLEEIRGKLNCPILGYTATLDDKQLTEMPLVFLRLETFLEQVDPKAIGMLK
jgi:hypothetical protein